MGNEAKDRMTELFFHTDDSVRSMAASFLLEYKSKEALEVLKEVAKGSDLVAFGARETIRSWESGEWNIS